MTLDYTGFEEPPLIDKYEIPDTEMMHLRGGILRMRGRDTPNERLIKTEVQRKRKTAKLKEISDEFSLKSVKTMKAKQFVRSI